MAHAESPLRHSLAWLSSRRMCRYSLIVCVELQLAHPSIFFSLVAKPEKVNQVSRILESVFFSSGTRNSFRLELIKNLSIGDFSGFG